MIRDFADTTANTHSIEEDVLKEFSSLQGIPSEISYPVCT